MSCFLQTGQKTCHDADGIEILCSGTGQDAELSLGIPWPSPRFEVQDQTALDLLTGLTWPLDANPAEFPLDWQSALEFIEQMNNQAAYGFSDWRLPSRCELRSLISYQASRPALPEGHPFINVFQNWYWTATAAAIDHGYAWYVHLGGGRMFYGAKNQYFMLWPVGGKGNEAIFCAPPAHRFQLEAHGQTVFDRLTGLSWMRLANLSGHPVAWENALEAIGNLNEKAEEEAASRRNMPGSAPGKTPGRHQSPLHFKALGSNWRLPNINELESLVDVCRHHPALPPGHPFRDCQEVYWSSTTSAFEPDWAWALYLDKGAVGVGRKRDARFHIWAVSGPQ